MIFAKTVTQIFIPGHPVPGENKGTRRRTIKSTYIQDICPHIMFTVEIVKCKTSYKILTKALTCDIFYTTVNDLFTMFFKKRPVD